MKNTLLITLSTLLVIGLYSFNLTINKSEEIIGVWVYSDYNDGIIEYVKSEKFKKDVSGIEFKKNGSLIKRQNVGWCGTPPITYGNDRGSWEFTSDSTVTIKYDYWGGEAEQDWEIIELNSSKLKINMIDYRTIEK